MDIKFELCSEDAVLPTRATSGSAGLDLYSPKDFSLHRDYPVYVDLGVRVEIPDGHVGLLVARSSMGRSGVTLSNSIGVIDSDFRGVLGVTLINHGPHGFMGYKKGDRIAQLVITPFLMCNPVESDNLSDTERGEGGFGSTGL
jgi:dUTP pyrophosphatase